MANQTKRLGRGLESLLQDIVGSVQDSGAIHEKVGYSKQPGGSSSVMHLAIDQIDRNPFQPRRVIDPVNLESLAESIRQSGVIQPVVVRPQGERFELIAGERRLQASRLVGKTEIPAIVRAADNDQMLELALVENIQREGLNAIDRALAYQQYCSTFDASPEELGNKIGENRTTIVNYLRLLELPEKIQEWVSSGHVSMGHARAILGLKGAESQVMLAKQAMDGQLSVRQVEDIVRRARVTSPPSRRPGAEPERPKNLQVSYLEQKLEQTLKTKVRIHCRDGLSGGHVQISFNDNDEFERICGIMGVSVE